MMASLAFHLNVRSGSNFGGSYISVPFPDIRYDTEESKVGSKLPLYTLGTKVRFGSKLASFS